MSSPSNRQVGGNHYDSTYQHWDLVDHLGLKYLPAQITRYIARWRKKNGIEDLEKALHYIDKYIWDETERHKNQCYNMEYFMRENKLQEHERIVFNMLINYQLGDADRLVTARDAITDLLMLMKGKKPEAVVPEDPKFKDEGDEWNRSNN